MNFKELQELIKNNDIYIAYDNDFFELRKYPFKKQLTQEEDSECIIVHSDEIDFNTFPKNQLYVGNQYGNGLMVLFANTPNHRIKEVVLY